MESAIAYSHPQLAPSACLNTNACSASPTAQVFHTCRPLQVPCESHLLSCSAAFELFAFRPHIPSHPCPSDQLTTVISVLHMCRDEAAAELSRERALWELLELLFVQPPTAHGTAAEVSAGRIT